MMSHYHVIFLQNLEEKKTVINSLSKHLRKLQTLTDICPITTAKVPIIKFYHRKLRVEGDISMENKLVWFLTLIN